MSYMITAECINCSACEMDCPVRAISPAASQYVIDPQVCIECEGYFDEPRCKHVCPVNACAPARETYLFKAGTLAHRGAPPWILKPAVILSLRQTLAEKNDPQPPEELRRRLDALQKKLEIVTNKETRAEIRYEIAEIQWQLGLISDEEFHQIEEFYESFTYEWC